MSTLYVAFKGNGNSSNKIVRNLSGDKLFLTNSYNGLKDFNSLAIKLNTNGIITTIGDMPIHSLCNEAYWYMLRKFNHQIVRN